MVCLGSSLRSADEPALNTLHQVTRGRLARDCERLPETLAGLHSLTFAVVLRHRFVEVLHFST